MFDEYKSVVDFKEQCGYTIDGDWFPRVTKIVSIKAKPALYYYYGEAKSYASAKAQTEQSALEGTMLHEAVEGLLLGNNPEIPDQIAPAVNSFLQFVEQNKIHVTPERVERRIINRDHRYAGTVDAIAEIGGKLGVLDIKTSQAIYRDYSLQTSAYMDALKDEFENLETRWILKIDQTQDCTRCGARRRVKGGRETIKSDWRNPATRGCVHVWSDMKGDIELQEFPSWRGDFTAFLGAKRLWEWENEAWLTKAGYLQ
jgi:hypothetical protein